MSSSGPPERVPTLTEVVHLPGTAPVAAASHNPPPPGAAVQRPPPATTSSTPTSSTPTAASADELIQQVFTDLQRQVELMLEYRLRETLAPLLTRAADSIVRDARTELASTLRDVVARAVAQEMSRQRPR